MIGLYYQSLLCHTAVCVDPAKYLPKPESANLKVVQMNLIMWLARLGFPHISFLAPREVELCGFVVVTLSASSLLL